MQASVRKRRLPLIVRCCLRNQALQHVILRMKNMRFSNPTKYATLYSLTVKEEKRQNDKVKKATKGKGKGVRK